MLRQALTKLIGRPQGNQLPAGEGVLVQKLCEAPWKNQGREVGRRKNREGPRRWENLEPTSNTSVEGLHTQSQE